MKEYLLSEKEIIVLASLRGGSEIFGIPNAFAEIQSESALEDELVKLRGSLTDKGVLSREDGSIPPEYAKMLDVLIHPAYFIAADGQRNGAGLPGQRIYIGNGSTFFADLAGKNCKILEIDGGQSAERFRGYVDWSGYSGSLPSMRATLPQKELPLLAKMPEAEAMRRLTDAGLNEEGAALALAGLLHQSDFYSFVLIDFTAGSDRVQSLMFLADKRGVMELRSERLDDADYVVLESTAPEQLAQKLDTVVRQAIPAAGGVQ